MSVTWQFSVSCRNLPVNQALGPRVFHQSKIAGQALPILSHSKTCDLNCGPTKFALVGLWPTIRIRSEGLGVGYLLPD